jgi:hypothetical protein
MPVFAWLDTIIQRVWESLRPKESFESLQKWFTFGNIYESAHNLAEKQLLATTAQALGNMTDDLNYSYNCDLDINQVSNILLTIDFARNDIQAMAKTIKEATPKWDQDSFISSCNKLINCVSKWNNNTSIYGYNTWEKTTSLTDYWFSACKSLSTNAYNRNVTSTKLSVTLASTNAWNDIYYNGTLDDSPYDILVDIQRIWDILFTSNEQSEKVLFYTFPKNSIAWFQAVPFDQWSRLTPFGASTQIWNNWNQWTWINTTTNTNTSFVSTNTNGWNIQIQWTSQWWYNNTTPVYQNTTNTTTNGWIIDNYACNPITQVWWNTWQQDNQNNWTNWTNTNNNQNQSSQNNWNTYIPPIFDSNTPYYSPIVWNSDDPVVNSEWREDPEQYEQQEAQIKACTSKCEWLKTIDKAMCIAKCTCWTTYTKNWMFWLSICTVPTTQTDIVSSKSVQSIEEIVAEINNVLKNLKQSGEMMKHTKTTEFLDTSLSKIKLGKIFAFDVSMSFKPILDTKPRKLTDAQAENETDNILRWNYGSIDIGAEKNKYAVLWIAELEHYQAIKNSLSESIAVSQNAEVADIVRDFLEQNIRFWTYIHESLDKIQITAWAIKQKIEKK